MQGLKVKCPNCGRTDFITTDKYNPDVRPNGGMVKCTLPYYIDWLTTSSTVCAEMTCPECMAQLAPSGVLNVLVPARECGKFFAEDLNCVYCGDPVSKEDAILVECSSKGKKRTDVYCGHCYEKEKYSLPPCEEGCSKCNNTRESNPPPINIMTSDAVGDNEILFIGKDAIKVENVGKDDPLGELIAARGPMEILESLGEKIAAQQDEPEPVERRKEVQSGKKRGKTK
jgi:hypothetical protein